MKLRVATLISLAALLAPLCVVRAAPITVDGGSATGSITPTICFGSCVPLSDSGPITAGDTRQAQSGANWGYTNYTLSTQSPDALDLNFTTLARSVTGPISLSVRADLSLAFDLATSMNFSVDMTLDMGTWSNPLFTQGVNAYLLDLDTSQTVFASSSSGTINIGGALAAGHYRFFVASAFDGLVPLQDQGATGQVDSLTSGHFSLSAPVDSDQSVPEPATWGLVTVAGVAGMAVRRRRRQTG